MKKEKLLIALLVCLFFSDLQVAQNVWLGDQGNDPCSWPVWCNGTWDYDAESMFSGGSPPNSSNDQVEDKNHSFFDDLRCLFGLIDCSPEEEYPTSPIESDPIEEEYPSSPTEPDPGEEDYPGSPVEPDPIEEEYPTCPVDPDPIEEYPTCPVEYNAGNSAAQCLSCNRPVDYAIPLEYLGIKKPTKRRINRKYNKNRLVYMGSRFEISSSRKILLRNKKKKNRKSYLLEFEQKDKYTEKEGKLYLLFHNKKVFFFNREFYDKYLIEK